MKQRKLIDLNSRISAEALIWEDGKVELSLKVGKKEYRIAGDEVIQLRDWLSYEVLREERNDAVVRRVIGGTVVSQDRDFIRPSLVPDPNSEAAKKQTLATPFGDRIAVSSSPQSGGYRVPVFTKADNLEMINLNGQISQAKEAFSPANLNRPEKM